MNILHDDIKMSIMSSWCKAICPSFDQECNQTVVIVVHVPALVPALQSAAGLTACWQPECWNDPGSCNDLALLEAPKTQQLRFTLKAGLSRKSAQSTPLSNFER